MAAESGEGAAVEEQESLGRGSGGGAGGRAPSGGGSGLLVVSQQGDLIVRQAERGIGH